MNQQEAAALLAVAAAFDNRKPDADAALAWAAALDGLSPADCRDAIVAHYRATRDWLMPADIVKRVRAVQSERLRAHEAIQPPDGLSSEEYSQWYADTRRRIANGEHIEPEPRQIAAHPPAEVADYLSKLRAAEKAEREKRDKPPVEETLAKHTQEEA